MMKHFVVSAAALISSVYGACCYTPSPKFLSVSNFDLNLAIVSTLKTNSNISIVFPASYLVKGSPRSCKSGTSAFDFTCTYGASSIFNGTFTLFTPGNSNGMPQVTVKANGETCESATWCKGFDTAGTVMPTSDGAPDGYVNLGPLGAYPPATFWPVMVGIILVVVGMGYFFFMRIKKVPSNAQDIEAQEEAMARSSNRAGWFGEKRPDAGGDGATVPSNNKGYAPFSKAGKAAAASTTATTAAKSKMTQKPATTTKDGEKDAKKAPTNSTQAKNERRSSLTKRDLMAKRNVDSDDDDESVTGSDTTTDSDADRIVKRMSVSDFKKASRTQSSLRKDTRADDRSKRASTMSQSTKAKPAEKKGGTMKGSKPKKPLVELDDI
ncbi:hypothetical protein MP228_008401 [Amoeboaphelidium protococcarum]|nr:hypothetical protein MP228_008401 [Amoeboaphelidium protococcarum]